MHDCMQHPGHYDTWRCERCGRRLIILPAGDQGERRVERRAQER